MSFIAVYMEMLGRIMTPQIVEPLRNRIIFNAISIICAVVILALFVVTAVLSKKQRVIGIIAGVANFVCALTIPMYLKGWHNLKIGVFSFNSSAEASEFLVKQFISLLFTMIPLALIVVSFVLSLIFVIKGFKNKPAIFSIGALVIVILRQFWVAPAQMSVPMFVKLLMADNAINFLFLGQVFQLFLFFGTLALALVLVLIPAIIAKVKGEKAPVTVEAAEEAPATEEVPASEEAPKAE